MRAEHTAVLEPAPDGSSLGAAASVLAAPNDLVGPFEVAVASRRDAPRAARAAVTAWLSGHVSTALAADAELLVFELVANSVRHADAPDDAVIRVRARVERDALRFEVEDAGTTGAIARRAPDLQYGGGFGLHLVELLSRRWGVHRDTATRVWAELALPAAG